MTTTEFSNQFDVLYNNITSNQAPGLDEYEKSVFLTKAQDELVKNAFSAESPGNNLKKGFDDSIKRQADFSMLMVTTLLHPLTLSVQKFDPRSIFFKWPEDLLVVVNECVTFGTSTDAPIRQVQALSYQEYNRLMSKPFKSPLKNQAWRLITGTSGNPLVEVIIGAADYKKYSIRHYRLRYVKIPAPIILVDLDNYSSETLSIHGKTEVSECELDPITHEQILQRAVELAKVQWLATDANGLQAEIAAGQRSE